MGESPQDLEPFHPDRMASRILGMGDVVSLVEKAQREMDEDTARESAEKMLKAQFSLEDFLTQLREVKKLGPLQDILAMLPAAPGGGNLKDLEVDENELVRAEAIISSMTLEERRNPTVLNGSRRSRVARGSGTSITQVNSLLKQYDETKKMMKRLGGGGLGGLAKGLGGLGGMKLPKGLG
jgi:signal recognition particle subunit SRP54